MSNYRKTMSQALQEMYPINEDNIDLMRKAAGGAAQTVKMKDGKLKMDMFTASAIMQILDKVNPANKKKMTDMINKGTKDGMMKLQDFAMKQVKSENDPEIEEDVDLDEADDFKPHMMYDPKTGKGYKADTMDDHLRMKKMGYNHDAPKTEEVDLDEGKMSQLHQYIKDKKSPEEIAKLMKVDVKTIKTLMSSNNPEDVEESAASDARRAMSRDKDLGRGKDSADDDDDATDDDVKGASKNIMMQLRKAQSLKGRFDVEFADGKKTKVSANIAMAVQQKYNAQKRPAEKEKFQAKIGKSYKDMLSALKEELQPKKESVLERMNRKIKENKDG